MKKINRENQITRESILTALFLLMDEKDFSRISITEICKKAGVSRMAYYRNYNFKEDIIKNYLDDLFEDYQRQVEKQERDRFQAARLYFSYFRKQKDFIKKLLKAGLSLMLLEKFNSYLKILFKNFTDLEAISPEEEPYRNSFFAGGLYQVLITWVHNNMKHSDQQMAQLVYFLMTGQPYDSN